MKVVYIILGVVAVVFIGSQIFGYMSQRNIESYPYKVVKEMDNIEIRAYEPSLFTSVKVGSSYYDQASSQGFRVLAGYIFGDNSENEKIAMTSPVTMSLEENTTMMFMVPKKYDKESLPAPNQSNIEFKEEPARTMAAIKFGGWANDEKIERYKLKLVEALKEKGIEHTNRFYFFGYNAPYEMINRRNEVLVELDPSTMADVSKL